jgi:hypothetical protein
MCHMPCPSHFPWFYHSNSIWWQVQITKLLIMQCFFKLLLLSPTLCSQTLLVCAIAALVYPNFMNLTKLE